MKSQLPYCGYLTNRCCYRLTFVSVLLARPAIFLLPKKVCFYPLKVCWRSCQGATYPCRGGLTPRRINWLSTSYHRAGARLYINVTQ